MKNTKVLVYGNFNIIHPGHLRLLRFAKNLGDNLIVGIFSDKMINNEKILSQKHRLDAVKNLKLVNKAIIVNEDIVKFIKKIKPKIVVKGKEHEKLENKEYSIIKKIGAKLIFSSGVSTFNNLNENFYSHNHINNIPKRYLDIHKINKRKIINNIEDFKKLNVLVLGDIIIDEVISCDPIGMSQESPTIVVSPNKKTKFLGGAGIVSAHCSSFTKNTWLYSIGNDDNSLRFIKDKLKEYKIKGRIFTQNEFTNNYKKKYISDNSCLLKVSELNRYSLPSDLEKKIYNEIKKIIKKIDVLIISDFNYGCLNYTLIDKTISLCNKNKVPVCVDSQSSSQLGDILKFKNIDLISATEREARISLKNSDDGLIEIAEKVIKKTNSENLVIKLNKNGIIIHSPKQRKKRDFYTDKLPALNKNPQDTSGAGDSFLCGTALSLAKSLNIWEASLIGSIFAAYQVENFGNVPIDRSKILSDIVK